MTYIPQAGTFPARVIDYLRSLPAGSERSSAELAEELDQDRNVVANLLQYPRGQGVLKARKVGRLVYWSLGDGIPEPMLRDLPPHSAPEIPKRPVGLFPGVPRGEPEPPAVPFRAALWSDGTLNIERNGLTVWLLPDEVAQLRGLLRGGA